MEIQRLVWVIQADPVERHVSLQAKEGGRSVKVREI